MPRPSVSLVLLLSCLNYVSATGRLPDRPQVSGGQAQLAPAWQAPIAASFIPTDSLATWATTGNTATQEQQQQRRVFESNSSPGRGNKALDEWDVLLLVLTAITLFIAAGGGIGGGAVFVVLNVFLGGFSAAQAVALSNITILGGSLANFLANSRRRHPTLERPLIDYDLMLVMEPTTMLGALLGGYMNKLLPVWLTSCLLAALLLLLTWKLLRRGTATFIAESRLKRQQAWQQQQQGQEQVKQQRRRALPATTGTQEQPLTEPLLLDDEAAEGGCSDDTGAGGGGADTGRSGAAGTGLVLAAPRAEAPCSSGPAWLAAGLTEQQQQQQTLVAAEAEALQSVVVPVPAHLRPLSIMSHEESLAQDQQGSARAGSSASARAAAVAAATGGDHTPPLIWSVPASATASFAAAAGAAERQGLLWGTSGQQQHHHQQRLRWGLSRCCPWLSPSAGSLAGILAAEARQLPWQPLLTLLLLSAWVVASDTLKGQLHCGSLGYWLVAASIVPPALFVTLVVRHWLLAKTAVKAAAAEACVSYGSAAAAVAAPASAAHAAAGGSIHWTPQNSVAYPLMCSAAGVVAGLFGVGGGIIKGPLMLELGVCPEVSAATSATMIMFTAGSAAVVYWNFGGVIPGWAAALASVGFVMTLVGQLATVRLVRALGRRSLIIFMMGLLMVLASGAAGYQSVRLVRAALAGPGSMWTWGSICR